MGENLKISDSEWASFVAQLKITSRDGVRLSPHIMQAHALTLSPFKDLLEKVKARLEAEGFKVY